MHIGGKIGQAIEKPFQYVDAGMHHWDNWLRSNNAPDMYFGVTSTDEGETWNPNIRIETNNQYTGQTQETTSNSYTPKPRPESGYSRNVAATTKDIAQGGMTKDEIIEFNMKHPNETAKRSE